MDLNTKPLNTKHNPWDRWSEAEKETHMRLQGARPVKWTVDLGLVNTVSEDGYVYVFAGGPVEGTPQAAVKKRADGKVDGRSKGVRKCGRCGESGHNARTCGRPRRKGPVSLPQTPRMSVPDQISAVTGLPVIERPPVSQEGPSEPVQTPSGEAPEPKSLAGRDSKRAAVRASKKGKRSCGKCGQPGHNARTCGQTGKVRHARAPGKTGRLNTCGKCGGKGHNARTCKA